LLLHHTKMHVPPTGLVTARGVQGKSDRSQKRMLFLCYQRPLSFSAATQHLHGSFIQRSAIKAESIATSGTKPTHQPMRSAVITQSPRVFKASGSTREVAFMTPQLLKYFKQHYCYLAVFASLRPPLSCRESRPQKTFPSLVFKHESQHVSLRRRCRL